MRLVSKLSIIWFVQTNCLGLLRKSIPTKSFLPVTLCFYNFRQILMSLKKGIVGKLINLLLNISKLFVILFPHCMWSSFFNFFFARSMKNLYTKYCISINKNHQNKNIFIILNISTFLTITLVSITLREILSQKVYFQITVLLIKVKLVR